jgi:hypothetical protein
MPIAKNMWPTPHTQMPPPLEPPAPPPIAQPPAHYYEPPREPENQHARLAKRYARAAIEVGAFALPGKTIYFPVKDLIDGRSLKDAAGMIPLGMFLDAVSTTTFPLLAGYSSCRAVQAVYHGALAGVTALRK